MMHTHTKNQTKLREKEEILNLKGKESYKTEKRKWGKVIRKYTQEVTLSRNQGKSNLLTLDFLLQFIGIVQQSPEFSNRHHKSQEKI